MTIEELKARWEEAAAKGDHATCYSIKQEIEALEHQAAVDAVQRKAKAEAARIGEAVEDAAATLRAIENHKAVRCEFEALVADLEQAAHAVDAALGRVQSEWPRLVHSYPHWAQYPNEAMQAAYDETLGAEKYPRFDPLKLRLRLPHVLGVLRERGSRGLTDLLNAADHRF